MKNLFAFTAFLAAGYLLGSRRTTKPVAVVAEFTLRGRDLVALSCQQNFRTKITD